MSHYFLDTQYLKHLVDEDFIWSPLLWLHVKKTLFPFDTKFLYGLGQTGFRTDKLHDRMLSKILMDFFNLMIPFSFH